MASVLQSPCVVCTMYCSEEGSLPTGPCVVYMRRVAFLQPGFVEYIHQRSGSTLNRRAVISGFVNKHSNILRCGGGGGECEFPSVHFQAKKSGQIVLWYGSMCSYRGG